MDNVQQLKLHPPCTVVEVGRSGIEDAIDRLREYPQEKWEESASTSAEALVSGENAQVKAWADKLQPLYESTVDHLREQTERAKTDVDEASVNTTLFTNRKALGSQVVSEKKVSFSIKRTLVEGRSGLFAYLACWALMWGEVKFAVVNLQASGLYSQYDSVDDPLLNLIPLGLAFFAVFLVMGIQLQKFSVYRALDGDADRKAYRELCNKRAKLGLLWIVMFALVMGTGIAGFSTGIRDDYPDFVKQLISTLNIYPALARAFLPLLMSIFLGVQIWMASTITTSLRINEAHNYEKQFHQDSRLNEAYQGRLETVELLNIRLINAATELAEIEAVQLELSAATVRVRDQILDGLYLQKAEEEQARFEIRARNLARHQQGRSQLKAV